MTKQATMPWHVEDRATRQNWATPVALFLEIERRYACGGFTIDAAAESWNAKCGAFFEQDDDALAQDWGEPGDPARVFLNPPYDDIGPWVRKAWLEVQRGNADLVVLLLPNRRGQRWWHEVVKPFASIVHDVIGRIDFDPPPGSDARGQSAFEDSVVVVFQLPLCASEFRRSRVEEKSQ